jgi:hypothetical protein
MGQNDLAFDLQESISVQQTGPPHHDIFDPTYRKLWGDPRWDAYRERIGMSKARLDAIEFDYQLPE